ncbi:unnamed protein product [Rotaria sordida]|uniref:Uncharacterized protein n=1 Tax=Rotaria sordida TaxID=392033 RepID=A0A814NRM9_9BILA|nr:unnamed protein product [Rotaria sordida]CAF1291680.1 unnamed protein product [Rotaria sordida]
MAWRPSYSNYPFEKSYSESDFRGNMLNSTTYNGDVYRHKYNCELAADASAYSRGSTYSDSTSNQYAQNLSSKDNVH